MRIKLQLTLILLLSFFWAQSQSVVSGTVTEESGAGIPGVNILVKGTNSGTTTDINGKYSLNVVPNSVLVFSFIGYVTAEVTVGTNRSLMLE
jgi:TonB-dependent starch-binding outer membrane protein SusC